MSQSTQDVVTLTRRWFEEVWREGGEAAVDALMAADGHGWIEGEPGVVSGPDDFKQARAVLLGAFPDMSVVVDSVTADASSAAVRWTVRGTHLGDHLGIAATGRPVMFRGMSWLEWRNGKVVRGCDSWNQGALLRELQAPPTEAGATTVGVETAALFRRDLQRLRQELDATGDGDLWRTAPGVTNAVGTLVLHLEGNLREYIGRQLGGVAFQRNRPQEFAARDVPRADLERRVDELTALVPRVLELLPAERWDARYPEDVLRLPLTVRQFVVHLHGHFNYHLGQIDYLRRMHSGHGALKLAAL